MPLFLPFSLKAIKKTGAMFFSCFSFILFSISFILHKVNLEETESIKCEYTFAEANLLSNNCGIRNKNFDLYRIALYFS
jgi:hypothetical protein